MKKRNKLILGISSFAFVMSISIGGALFIQPQATEVVVKVDTSEENLLPSSVNFNKDTGELVISGGYTSGTISATKFKEAIADFKADIKSIKVDPNVNVMNLYNPKEMFSDLANLESVDLTNAVISGDGDASGMFKNDISLKAFIGADILNGDVLNASYMFENCAELETIDLSTSKSNQVTNFKGMFKNCSSLKLIKADEIIRKSALDISSMFMNCTNLINGPVISNEAQNIKDMSSLYDNCTNLETVCFFGISSKSIENVSNMLRDCVSLEEVDLSSFDFSALKHSATNEIFNFYESTFKLKTIKLPSLKDMDSEIVFTLPDNNSLYWYTKEVKNDSVVFPQPGSATDTKTEDCDTAIIKTYTVADCSFTEPVTLYRGFLDTSSINSLKYMYINSYDNPIKFKIPKTAAELNNKTIPAINELLALQTDGAVEIAGSVLASKNMNLCNANLNFFGDSITIGTSIYSDLILQYGEADISNEYIVPDDSGFIASAYGSEHFAFYIYFYNTDKLANDEKIIICYQIDKTNDVIMGIEITSYSNYLENCEELDKHKIDYTPTEDTDKDNNDNNNDNNNNTDNDNSGVNTDDSNNSNEDVSSDTNTDDVTSEEINDIPEDAVINTTINVPANIDTDNANLVESNVKTGDSANVCAFIGLAIFALASMFILRIKDTNKY